MAAMHRGETEAGSALAEEAVDVANSTGDLVVIGEALVGHALVAQNDLPLAMRLNEEAISATERSGDIAMRAGPTTTREEPRTMATGEVDAARDHIEQAIAIFTELNSEHPIPLINLGWVHLQQEEPSTAVATFDKAMRLARQASLRPEIAHAALGLALCATVRRQVNRAAALHGFADTELRAIGQTWSSPNAPTATKTSTASATRWADPSKPPTRPAPP